LYICLCNAITDTDIAQAVEQGAARPCEVYTACGCRAQCGSCARKIVTMLRSLLPAEPDLVAACD
jgi:bacterioferritin-associated ferredoxin